MKPTPYRIAMSVLFYTALISGGCLIALEWSSPWGQGSIGLFSIGVVFGWFMLCVWSVRKAIDLGIWLGWDHEDQGEREP